jgi:hypothetical protein
LYIKLLCSGALLNSSNKSIPNIFVTELTEFTQSSKPLATFWSQDVAHKNFSGLFIILVINAVVFGLFTTLIFQI